MQEWFLPSVFTTVGVVLVAVGGVVGHLISSRAAKRATETQADANRRSNEQTMIDQLQEELVTHRSAQDARSTGMERRMTHLEERNIEVTGERDTLRDYAHDLRGYIFDGKPPPPPDWPEGFFK